MTALRFEPIDEAIVREVRETSRDAHGNQLHVRVSDDVAPCRVCLRIVPRGTRLILFAYCPFTTNGPYAEIGPVFIHADVCEPYREAATFPPDFRKRTLVFRAYDEDGEIHDATLADGVAAEETLHRLFADPAVATVHVRNPAWGCFDFAVARG
jgi:hypothetical protein